MNAENSMSLHFYWYLCQKFGSEEDVKVRRFSYIVEDLGVFAEKITSGSRGEGLELKGSDFDVMFIDPSFKVYESERDVDPQSGGCIPLVMDTDDTHPCFTKLRLPNYYDLTFENDERKNIFRFRKISSELYRLFRMNEFTTDMDVLASCTLKVHGPCISNLDETFDIAWCLKCDKWIYQAQQWISRARTTWPSPDLISKIISCGVLYVPIGYKGSGNENIQWRMSFSIAEKVLIFSFNHIQLLCYALLKILVKEIVETHEDLKTLLCSYFLKTLMFWISEETNPSMWRPEKIIPCFMACLKRLIYCVEYSTLLHYFIPENNLFYLRFEIEKNYKNNKIEKINKKDNMIRILKNLFAKGIYCFARSETLFDIMSLPFNSVNSVLSKLVALMHKIKSMDLLQDFRPLNMLYHLLHHSNTKISKCLFFEMLSLAHQNVPQTSQDQPISNNKQKYLKYKLDLSQLLIGTNSDAVGGWLVLASFFYVHKNYCLSLYIINHTLRKCTNEKISSWQIGFIQNQEYLLQLLDKKKLCTVSKSITIKHPHFRGNSTLRPQELNLTVHEQAVPFHPMIFAHLLSFLCYYHLHEIRSCNQILLQLRQTVLQLISTKQCYSLFIVCLGICHQMLGEIDVARQIFLLATQIDEHNLTSAAIRLFSLY